MRDLTAIAAILWAIALPAGAAPDPHALSRKLDDLYRSDGSHGRITMQVVNPDFQRTLTMEMWSRGKDDTLIRIEAPQKEAGTATLRRGKQMWNWLPRIRRTILIPPSMMMGSWMGSDFTNDDLVKESSWEHDYTVALAPQSPPGQVCLQHVPKPEAAVTWSKVITCFDATDEIPLTQDFFDEKGRDARRITYDQVKEVSGRKIPMRLTLTPLLETGRRTVVTYDDLELDAKVPESQFSLTELRR